MPRSAPKSKPRKPVVWSSQARSDLERIFDHIETNFTFDLAVQKADQIIDLIEALSDFPRKGAISPNFSGIRELIVEGNTVYYRDNELDIVIASIRPRRTAATHKP
jgi:plasmid stabilization system protein ParE